ncbi:MAG: hypothetical protein DRO04_02765 [Candidatus Iainarchaeum archaeon]|uniref:Uncharacterized protein n=1 Tax=Candidatus Iainarchaeum sp. TaxID=3101447 RepID=A0A497JIZ4_9ARCH|nr:MAG: hypothetical protein DRO04_02765 [Candidatus Diapherotrites archaeon]
MPTAVAVRPKRRERPTVAIKPRRLTAAERELALRRRREMLQKHINRFVNRVAGRERVRVGVLRRFAEKIIPEIRAMQKAGRPASAIRAKLKKSVAKIKADLINELVMQLTKGLEKKYSAADVKFARITARKALSRMLWDVKVLNKIIALGVRFPNVKPGTIAEFAFKNKDPTRVAVNVFKSIYKLK